MLLGDSNRLAISDSLVLGRLVPGLELELFTAKNCHELFVFLKVRVPTILDLA